MSHSPLGTFKHVEQGFGAFVMSIRCRVVQPTSRGGVEQAGMSCFRRTAVQPEGEEGHLSFRRGPYVVRTTICVGGSAVTADAADFFAMEELATATLLRRENVIHASMVQGVPCSPRWTPREARIRLV